MKILTAGLLLSATNAEKLQIVDCRNPILDACSRPLTMEEIADLRIQEFFDAMLALAKGEQSDQKKSVMVGLAAPQIGHSLRVILVDTKADGKGGVAELRVYVNPEILEFSQETEEWYEGCYSTGLVKGIVSRPSQVKIKAWDRNGNEIYETHTGYVARIFQHEIDHLNGIRFPDRVPSDQPLHSVKNEEMPQYRNQQAWRSWQNTLPQMDWKKHM